MRLSRQRASAALALLVTGLLAATAVAPAAQAGDEPSVSKMKRRAGVADIRINEVVSNGGTPGDWVELKNTGTAAVDVGGLRFRDNDTTHNYVIPAGTTIAAGGYYVLEEATFGFGLGSADEANLFQADGTTVVDSYAWTAHRVPSYGRCADGTGGFVQNTTVSKGSANICPSPYANLKVNEVESNGGSPGDWVELKNTGTSAVDISGIKFRDNDASHVQYAVPAGTTVAAGGYYLLEEAQFGFGLGGADSAIVWQPDGTTVIDRYDWTAHAAVTYGRCPDGTGPFVDSSSSTKGAPNDCNTVKINEVESDGGTPGDWVELKNNGTTSANIGGYVLRDNDNANGYVIPTGTAIPAGGYLVLDVAQFVFGLGSADSARLFTADGTTLVDTYTWTAHATTTYGRCPDGTGAFATTQASTKGAVNNCPGDLVTSPWPGGQTVTTVDPQGTFASNLSGLMYEPTGTPTPGSIWAVRNGPGALFKLARTQTGYAPAADFATAGKLLHYTDGTGDVDAEGVTFTSAGPDAGIFVASERNNAVSGTSRPAILRYDPTAPGSELSATNDWNLTADLPGLGANLGLEAISWVPDSYLTAKGFRDQNTNAAYTPSTYANHGNGLFLVGVEQTGAVYAYALDLTSNAYTRVASFASGFVSVMELYFEPETQQLWVVCDDGCQGRSSRFDVNASGVFAPTAYYERPTGMANLNNEGFTLAPQLECANGRKPAFWSDDSSTGGFALRQGTVSCTVVAPVNQVPPSIVGTVAVGSTVTADPGTWSPSDVTFAYQWFANNNPVPGATAQTFTPTGAQDGQFLSVRVIGTRVGSVPVTAVSGSTRVSTMPIVNTGAPVITGSAAVDATLTLSTGSWNYGDLTYTYAWYADGTAIRGATRSTYVVTAGMAGRSITGRVTASRPGRDAVVATSSNTITIPS